MNLADVKEVIITLNLIPNFDFNLSQVYKTYKYRSCIVMSLTTFYHLVYNMAVPIAMSNLYIQLLYNINYK